MLRRPDVCLLRATPISVPRNSGDSGRGARISLDHTNPALTVTERFVPGLSLAIEIGGLNVGCAVSVMPDVESQYLTTWGDLEERLTLSEPPFLI